MPHIIRAFNQFDIMPYDSVQILQKRIADQLTEEDLEPAIRLLEDVLSENSNKFGDLQLYRSRFKNTAKQVRKGNILPDQAQNAFGQVREALQYLVEEMKAKDLRPGVLNTPDANLVLSYQDAYGKEIELDLEQLDRHGARKQAEDFIKTLRKTRKVLALEEDAEERVQYQEKLSQLLEELEEIRRRI